MVRIRRVEIAAKNVKTLCWIGDRLADFMGGTIYGLDGSTERVGYFYAYRFDASVASPSGRWVVLYERLGTKGLLLGPDRRSVRELNRSYYQAHVYPYPVALFALADGREVIAHCPEKYNRLEIEEVETGRRLTARPEGAEPDADFFHSRLAVSPGGVRLLSAGWCWHPFDEVCVFDMAAALARPESLGWKTGPELSSEQSQACFVDEDRVAVASAREADDFWEGDEEVQGVARLRPGWIGTWNIPEARWETLAKLEEEAGPLMSAGKGCVVGFYECPKVIEVASGRVVERWADVTSGVVTGCIAHHLPKPPAVAVDAAGRRFAVAQGGRIVVGVVEETSIASRDHGVC